VELRIPAAFNRSVWFYDRLAQLIFGGVIRQSQMQLLSFIPAGASVLLLGGGTGWILEDLAQLHIPLEITYLEASPIMLAKARQVAAQLSNEFLKINFQLGTETSLGPEESFNVIFTPFVLDLYPTNQVKRMTHDLHLHLKPTGLWLLADFFISPDKEKGWPKWWKLATVKIMYSFFGWMEGLTTKSLPDLPLVFQELSLNLLSSQSFLQGFICSQVYQNNHKTK
jgi:tRNA (cmo5U34)-methyltransferase